jgi:hypothetical protein
MSDDRFFCDLPGQFLDENAGEDLSAATDITNLIAALQGVVGIR